MIKPQNRNRPAERGRRNADDLADRRRAIVERARRDFAVLDQPEGIKTIAERVAEIRREWESRSSGPSLSAEMSTAQLDQAMRQIEVARRCAALAALFEVPALLHRTERFSEPDFRWIRDQLFRICLERDYETLRHYAARHKGRPAQSREAFRTAMLVAAALNGPSEFHVHLQERAKAPGLSRADRAAIEARLEQFDGETPTLQSAMEAVAKLEGISVEGVRSRLRKARLLPEVRAYGPVFEAIAKVGNKAPRSVRSRRRLP